MSELLWSAVITGDTRTKKNSPRIAGGRERCPACGKPRKQWIVPSKAHDLWFRDASRQLRLTKAENIKGEREWFVNCEHRPACIRMFAKQYKAEGRPKDE